MRRATRPRAWRWRRRAASRNLHAPEAIPALEALKRAQPRQEGPTIDRLIARLRKGPAGSELEKLRGQVEKLEKRCREMDERLQDLDAKKA